ncbi:hypothetical protein TYRP_006268 [Tyrophagus putrescentiae]|nr:hypothetical protein TYRP_006268 [Tyrophagus putrescentiae]
MTGTGKIPFLHSCDSSASVLEIGWTSLNHTVLGCMPFAFAFHSNGYSEARPVPRVRCESTLANFISASRRVPRVTFYESFASPSSFLHSPCTPLAPSALHVEL